MATDAFLVFKAGPNQPLITGESLDQTYGALGAIELQAWSFGVSDPTTIGSTTAGAGAGKAKLNQLLITKTVDKASAALVQYATQGLHLPEVDLYVRKAGGPQLTYLVYNFGVVFITDIEWSGGAGTDQPSEQVTLVYGSFQVKYTPQNPDGTLQVSSAQQANWSQIQNRAVFQTTVP